MRISSPLALTFALLLGWGAGCGKEIGDSCSLNSDCSPNGDRQCLDPLENDGYCSIQGCDFDTCPDEAVCVRFFTGGFSNRPCLPACEDLDPSTPLVNAPPECKDEATGALAPTDDCTFDELCPVSGFCVPRSSEVRFCMRKCDSDGDCRDNFECRDLERMKTDGGEPVLAGGGRVDEKSPKFCATAP